MDTHVSAMQFVQNCNRLSNRHYPRMSKMHSYELAEIMHIDHNKVRDCINTLDKCNKIHKGMSYVHKIPTELLTTGRIRHQVVSVCDLGEIDATVVCAKLAPHKIQVVVNRYSILQLAISGAMSQANIHVLDQIASKH